MGSGHAALKSRPAVFGLAGELLVRSVPPGHVASLAELPGLGGLGQKC